MNKWQSKKTTTPQQETQQEPQLPPSKENIGGATEAQVIQQIGQLLRQINYYAQLSQSQVLDAPSNLVIPVTVEAMSFALWAMANHLMNSCDLLRTLASTSNRSFWTILNDEDFDETLNAIEGQLMEFLAL